MADITASQKFSCPSCGGEAQWNPAKNALVCPFCGTTTPVEVPASGGPIKENDLASALRNVDDAHRGWAAAKTSVKCQSCQAISVFDPARVSQRCEFCGSTALVPYEQTRAPIRPESLLEFKVAETRVREQIREWYGSRFWAPNAMKSKALTDTVHGVYLPYWTFDADVHAEWQADAGYHYYTSESYTDSEGNSRTRQVQHTRWEPAWGSLNHFFDDDLVAASKGVQPDLLRQVEPFPTTTDLKPYDPAFLSGWVVEQYQIDLIAAAQHSRQSMEQEMYNRCSSDVPGDTQRNLRVQTDYSGQTFKHILVPVWLLSYTYGSTSYQVVINGYTGSIAGKYPLSWGKILLAIILGLIVAAIAFAMFGKN
ncbi:zinc ribbon domain-containing protein [bacterium]|nr:MAG: zinc ribbon domain-containing protein [bacterium]